MNLKWRLHNEAAFHLTHPALSSLVRLTVLTILPLAAALQGCAVGRAPPATASAEQSAAREIRLKLVGKFEPAGDKSRTLYLEFAGSAQLTAALRQAFAARGYLLAAQREQAEVTYLFDGAFQAVRPATHRTAAIALGDYAEHPEHLVTTSGRGPAVMLSLNPFAAITGTVLQNAADQTGVQDAINAALGDPDGQCLAKCERWAYKQRAVVTVERLLGTRHASALSAQSEVTADQLLPDQLASTALHGLELAIGLDPFSATPFDRTSHD